MPIREGLARLEGVASISPRPNVKEGTCELRMKSSRLLDPEALSRFIYDIRVGARLRGLVATVDGVLEKRADQFVLRVSGSDETLRLAPLTRKVEQDVPKKTPLPPTRQERRAFAGLAARWKGKPLAVRIMGPLTRLEGHGTTLEVQRFELVR